MSSNRFLLQHILDESAVRYPDRIAIRADGCSITYHELTEKSNKLARLLIDSGLNQKSVVGIFMSKSIKTVIAMFAVFKSGCCIYSP